MHIQHDDKPIKLGRGEASKN